MEQTSPTRECPFDGDPGPVRHAESGSGSWSRVPIYAGLVREWRARGRAVPGQTDLPWVSFAGLPAGSGADTEDPVHP